MYAFFVRRLPLPRGVASALGAIQLATMFALVGSVPIAALLVRHFTDDYFVPVASYLGSLKVAVPPVALFVITYALSFLTGTPASEIPKTALTFLRNTFFQSRLWMSAAITAVVAAGLTFAVVDRNVTAPSYYELVRLILAGGADDLSLARERVDAIRPNNVPLAVELGKVIEVFRERSQVNGGGRSLSGDRARTFIRSLEAQVPAWWQEHPLRRHSLAEAYLLYGQAVDRAASAAGGGRPAGASLPYGRAVELYTAVTEHEGPLVPPLLRAAAQNNLGNAFYYMGDYQSALTAWNRANSEQLGRVNLNSWSNIVAALVLLDRPHDAIDEGERARNWAERTGRALVDTFAFAGLLENTGFARMQVGDRVAALEDMAAAHAFREDNLTRQNLAIALILNGRHDRAQDLLRQIAAPVQVDGGVVGTPDTRVARCVYLLWALALSDGQRSTRTANLSAFLGEVRSAAELMVAGPSDEQALRDRAIEALARADYPCQSLSRIGALIDRLR